MVDQDVGLTNLIIDLKELAREDQWKEKSFLLAKGLANHILFSQLYTLSYQVPYPLDMRKERDAFYGRGPKGGKKKNPRVFSDEP
jgi:hypothetical protein